LVGFENANSQILRWIYSSTPYLSVFLSVGFPLPSPSPHSCPLWRGGVRLGRRLAEAEHELRKREFVYYHLKVFNVSFFSPHDESLYASNF